MRLLLSVFCFFLFTSCYMQNPNQLANEQPESRSIAQASESQAPSVRDEEEAEERSTARRRSSSLFSDRSSRSNSRSASRKKGCDEEDWGDDLCVDDDRCVEACGSVFKDRRSEDKCADRPAALVKEMLDLVEDFERVSFRDVDSDVLRCIFDIDSVPITREIKRFRERDQKELLALIAEDEDLASVFSSEDDKFSIFQELVGGSDTPNLKESIISGGETFLSLVSYNQNEEAWDYLDKYLEDYCDDHESSCTVKNFASHEATQDVSPFKIYCEILAEEDEDELETIVDSEFFKDEYGENIEGNPEEYTANRVVPEYKICTGRGSSVAVTFSDDSDDRCDADNVDHVIAVCEAVAGVSF